MVAAMQADGSHVMVGVFEGSTRALYGGARPTGSGHQAPLIAEYATIHEFGTAGVPAKAFMRTGVANAAASINAKMAKAWDDMLAGRAPEVALAPVAILGQAAIKDSIRAFGLIDTGAMRNSILWEIRQRTRVLKKGPGRRH
jgi:hypothetical protein